LNDKNKNETNDDKIIEKVIIKSECDDIRHTITPIMFHDMMMPITIGIYEKQDICEYVYLYEEKTNRLIGTIPINNIICEKINRNVEKKLESLIIHPGEIKRIYVYSSCNKLEISSDSELNGRIGLGAMELYENNNHDDRETVKFFSHESSIKIDRIVAPFTPIEITLFTPWSSQYIENIDLKIVMNNVETKIATTIYDIGETVKIIVGNENDSLDCNKTFNEEIKITNVTTKYYPINNEIIDVDGRYQDESEKDKDKDKEKEKMKKIVLTYKLKNHLPSKYYINTNNRIYDSQIYMSGVIRGYRNDRHVFTSNYKEKTCDEEIDMITIEFIDSNVDLLNKCKRTILNVTRKVNITIKDKATVKKGTNYINIDPNELDSIKNIKNGDIICCMIFNTKFYINYMSSTINKMDEKTNDKKNDKKGIINNYNIIRKMLHKIKNNTWESNDWCDNNEYSDELIRIRKLFFNDNNNNNDENVIDHFMKKTIVERNHDMYLSIFVCNTHEEFKKRLKLLINIFECNATSSLMTKSPYFILKMFDAFVERDLTKYIDCVNKLQSNVLHWSDIENSDIDSLMSVECFNYFDCDDTKKKKIIRKINLRLNTDEYVEL
jgi:hypothetical protein